MAIHVLGDTFKETIKLVNITTLLTLLNLYTFSDLFIKLVYFLTLNLTIRLIDGRRATREGRAGGEVGRSPHNL